MSNGEDSPCLRVPMDEKAEWLPIIVLLVVLDKIVVITIFVWGSNAVLFTSPMTWKFPKSSIKDEVPIIWMALESRVWANTKLAFNEGSNPAKVKMMESDAIKVVSRNRLAVFLDLNKLIVNYLTKTLIKIIC